MTDYNIDFKDHKVQFPNRFKQIQVSPGVVDLIPTWIENPSEVIEVGTPVNADLFDKLRANVTRRSETFAATAGQTVFNLTKAYLVDQGRIDVYISGIKQRSGIDFTETSPTSFTLSVGLDAGAIVEAVYFSASQALSEDLIEQVQAAEAATISANEAAVNAIEATEGALTANLNWKEPVNNLAALNALSNPQVRDTRQTRDTGDVYRYDGSAWVLIQTMDPNAITALDTRLTSQLAEKANKIRVVVNVEDFGAKGDGVTNDTEALNEAINSVTENALILFPGEEYLYDSLPNLAKRNVTYRGIGSGITKLKYTGVGTAMTLDAFASGNPTDQFIDNCNLEGISVVGEVLTVGIMAQGISRSHWRDVRVNGSDKSDGTIGINLKGCMLNNFSNIFCSEKDGSVPYRGIFIQAGSRRGVSTGGCSNNLFEHIYPEGNAIGLQIASNGGDQNVFSVGAPEKCSHYGLIVGANCRYNTFIALGCENLGVINADIDDSGIYSKFINCYSNEKTLLKGKGAELQGGFFERVEITSTAEDCEVRNVTVNHWNTVQGGFINAGKGTRYQNVYDADTSTYLYKNKGRFAVTVTGSPFQWTNTENVPVKVRLIGGTVTQVLIFRGTDFWEEPKPTAGNTTSQGIYLLAPGDKIDVSYSVAPAMNVIPLNNI